MFKKKIFYIYMHIVNINVIILLLRQAKITRLNLKIMRLKLFLILNLYISYVIYPLFIKINHQSFNNKARVSAP